MEIYVSTDKEKLEIDKIHHYISEETYWGQGRTIAEVIATIENSICFGLYSATDEQLGFARVVTDRVVFGYIMDFIIFNKNQGIGYGKKLLSALLKDDNIKNLKTIALKTKDAHGFYEQFGFKKVDNSPLWMSIDKVILL